MSYGDFKLIRSFYAVERSIFRYWRTWEQKKLFLSKLNFHIDFITKLFKNMSICGLKNQRLFPDFEIERNVTGNFNIGSPHQTWRKWRQITKYTVFVLQLLYYLLHRAYKLINSLYYEENKCKNRKMLKVNN